MSKRPTDNPELTDEEVAFEMIEITCEEIDSLSRAFTMIADLCRELNGQAPAGSSSDDSSDPSEVEIH